VVSVGKLKKVKKSVIFAPLDWGLGHATRCIPLINQYLSEGWEVRIASNGASLLLLKEEFPSLEFLEIPGYDIKYAPGSLMTFAILRQLPKLKKAIADEKTWLDNYLQDKNVDLIISDNRYGFHSDKCKSVFITHQLFIQVPLVQGAINKINHSYIAKFDECWVPDDEGEINLSGKLSHGKIPDNVSFIGPLSRFKKREMDNKYRVTAVLSGPEPSREKLEKKLINLLQHVDKSILIRGVQKTGSEETYGKLRVVDHVPQIELEELFNQSRLLICRNGYSSVMDLVKLKKEAILIPTPGQSEQEYLAKHLKNHPQFHYIKEENLEKNLIDVIDEFDFQGI